MKEKVLEIEIIKVNEDWSVWYITHQNEEVLPRGEFKDDELRVYSYNMPYFVKDGNSLGIRAQKVEDFDVIPVRIRNKDIPLLQKKVDQLNEKYGIEKIGNSGVDKDELKNRILTLQSTCNVLYFNLDSFNDEEIKNTLTGIKDMLEYILEAF